VPKRQARRFLLGGITFWWGLYNTKCAE